MNTFLKIAIGALLFAFMPDSMAADNNQNGGSSSGVVVRIIKRTTNPRPRDVTHDNVVECTVDNGWLTITFEEPEGLATVTLKDAGVNVMATGTYETSMVIQFPILYTGNPIQIIISTTEGNEYEGWIEL